MLGFATNSGYQPFVQFGSNKEEEARGITIDSNDNIYVTGLTWGSLPGFTLQGGIDAFIAKYNADGTQAWLKQFGTSGSDEVRGITTDNNGNIYVTGEERPPAFGPSYEGFYDVYIAKYNPNGTQAWVQKFGTSGYLISKEAPQALTSPHLDPRMVRKYYPERWGNASEQNSVSGGAVPHSVYGAIRHGVTVRGSA